MSTNQLSHQKMQRSRNMQSDVLHAVAEAKQVNVAKCLDVDSSTVGRWLDSSKPDSQLVRFCDILAFCGLKIVPANAKHYDKEKIDILFHITKYHFQNLEAVDDFFQNDAGMTDSTDARYSRTDALSEINTSSNIVSELLARFYEACKSLVAPKSPSRPTLLIARLNVEKEIEQERRDIVADETLFCKMFWMFMHIAAVLLVLFTLIHFWGK